MHTADRFVAILPSTEFDQSESSELVDAWNSEACMSERVNNRTIKFREDLQLIDGEGRLT